VALLALGLGSSAALQNAFTNGSFREVSAARIAEADARLLDALEQELGTRPASLRSARFTPPPTTPPATRPTASSPWWAPGRRAPASPPTT
jgi:hypothetical protein